ncbi:MAG: hypothetical protein AAFR28_06370, partial [Pseudomonadota bacterium]
GSGRKEVNHGEESRRHAETAGPIGGEGFAFPAGTCSFSMPATFFAMVHFLSSRPVARSQAAVGSASLRKGAGARLSGSV